MTYILFGEFTPHLSMIAKSGVLFLAHVGYLGKRRKARQRVDARLPHCRLDISGVHYVH
jgi:hypothetical protein